MPNFKEEMIAGGKAALIKSIAIWEDRAEGKENLTPCPLCDLSGSKCDGCPIDIAGQEGCTDTPYKAYAKHHDACAMSHCSDHCDLAQEEVEFLQGILLKIEEEEVENGSKS